MHPIVIPQEDVNSETARIVEWHAAQGDAVSEGAKVLTVETTKAVFDVEAPASGLFLPLFEANADVAFNVPVAYVAADAKELADLAARAPEPAAAPAADERKLTRKARQLALQYGIDPGAVPGTGILREKDVQDFLVASGRMGAEDDAILTRAGELPRGVERVVLLGGGLGAMQVLDILMNSPHQRVTGIVDDDETLRGTSILDVPVLGTSKDLEALYRAKRFDAAVVSISTNIPVRKRLFDSCRALGIPLTNAVDPTVRLNRFSRLGTGNVLCSFVHLGTCTVLGDNNFISAHCNLEHHNLWGSHITTGPGVMTSSRVKVGDEVKMGTGIFIQPGLAVGAGCQIASGAILMRSVPERHAVKSHITNEIVKIPD